MTDQIHTMAIQFKDSTFCPHYTYMPKQTGGTHDEVIGPKVDIHKLMFGGEDISHAYGPAIMDEIELITLRKHEARLAEVEETGL